MHKNLKPKTQIRLNSQLGSRSSQIRSSSSNSVE